MRSNPAFLSKLSETVENESSSDEESPVTGSKGKQIAPKKLTALDKNPLFLKRIVEIAAATEDPSERELIHSATASVLNTSFDTATTEPVSNMTRAKTWAQQESRTHSANGFHRKTLSDSVGASETHFNKGPLPSSIESPKVNRFKSPTNPTTDPSKVTRTQSFDSAANIKDKLNSIISQTDSPKRFQKTTPVPSIPSKGIVESPKSLHKKTPTPVIHSQESPKMILKKSPVSPATPPSAPKMNGFTYDGRNHLQVPHLHDSPKSTSSLEKTWATKSANGRTSTSSSQQSPPQTASMPNTLRKNLNGYNEQKSPFTTTTTSTAAVTPNKGPHSSLPKTQNRDVIKKDLNPQKTSNTSSSSSSSSLSQNPLFLKRQAIVSAAEENNSFDDHDHDHESKESLHTPSPAQKDKTEKKTESDEKGGQNDPLYTLSQSSLFLKRVALVNVDQRAVIEEKFIKGTKIIKEKNHQPVSVDVQIQDHGSISTAHDGNIDSMQSYQDKPSFENDTSFTDGNNNINISSSVDVDPDVSNYEDSFQVQPLDDEDGDNDDDRHETSNESVQFNVQYEFGGMQNFHQGGLPTGRSEYESFFHDDFSRSFDEASIGSYSNAAVHKTAFTNDQMWENLFTDMDNKQLELSWDGKSDDDFIMRTEPSFTENFEPTSSPWKIHDKALEDFDSDLVFFNNESDEKMIRNPVHPRADDTVSPLFEENKPPAENKTKDVASDYTNDHHPINTNSHSDFFENIHPGKHPITSETANPEEINLTEVSTSECKPYLALLPRSLRLDVVRVSEPSLVSDFLSAIDSHRPKIMSFENETEDQLKENFPLKPSTFMVDAEASKLTFSSRHDHSPKEANTVNSFESPFRSTESVSQWWKNNYASTQGDDVNLSVDHALFPDSISQEVVKPSMDKKLQRAKSEEDIFSGIQDLSDTKDSRSALSTSRPSNLMSKINVEETVKSTQENGSRGPSFIPPFSTERKSHDKVDYPKYQADLMTATSDITFDMNSRIDQNSLKVKKVTTVQNAYGKPHHINKQRSTAQKPVVSESSNENLDPSTLISLLAGRITCGALGPLMAAFDDPSSKNNMSHTTTAENKGKKYHCTNRGPAAVVDGASNHNQSYEEDGSRVESEISSRIYLSKKEKKIWDLWDKKDGGESKPKSTALSSYMDDDSQLPESVNSDMKRMKHQEKRAVAHEKLLLHAYAALSFLSNNQYPSVNANPFSFVSSISNNRQALERFCQGIKSGMAILKLNRDQKWHLRYLTISQEGHWLTSGEGNQDNGYFPVGLLWVKKINKSKGHSISSIDADGRGGLLLADIIRIDECFEIGEQFPLAKKQERDYPDSVTVRIQTDHKGHTRYITFRCSKAASTVIITGCRAAIALLGDSIRSIDSSKK